MKVLTNNDIYQLAVKEAYKLHEFTTSEEKKRLFASRVDSRSQSNCIYGQLTGFCHSRRAIELMNKCCTVAFRSLGEHVNKPEKKAKRLLHSFFRTQFSPLERALTTATKKQIATLCRIIKKGHE